MKGDQLPLIPQTDPKANYLVHKAEIEEAITGVLTSGRYILGREVRAFEEEFGAYIGVRHAIAVASGTDALEIALRACGVGPGDAVFTVSHTAVATVAAIEHCGAIPVLVDIDPATYTMDPNHLDDLLKTRHSQPLSAVGRSKAVIPVHLYGHPADMPAIVDIARCFDLCVIEDCAQAHGATFQGHKVGTWGRMVAFSFYPTKNLGGLGDGGMVLTNDQDLAERTRMLREYGWRERYVSEMPGLNSRLDELQAAILRVKLRYLSEDNDRRHAIAQYYDSRLSETGLGLPHCAPNAEHVYHQYVIRSPLRDKLQEHLKQKGIGTLIHYPVPIHLQPAYRGRLGDVGSFPQSEQAASQILSLPMFPELRTDQVRTVVKKIAAWSQEMSF